MMGKDAAKSPLIKLLGGGGKKIFNEHNSTKLENRGNIRIIVNNL